MQGSLQYFVYNPHFKYTFLSFIIPFTRTHEPNELACLQPCDFIAQLVEHCAGIIEVVGSGPVKKRRV